MKRFFVALTLLTALSICLHSGYAQQDENEELGPVSTPVDERTPAVTNAIMNAVPEIDNPADVTGEHLADITELTIITHSTDPLRLMATDFEGLTGLTTLDLSYNQISELPGGVFDDLTALTTLDLSANRIDLWSSDIFDNLTALTTLNLKQALGDGNSLTEDTFANLAALTTLDLSLNRGALSLSLRWRLFNNLTNLTTLNLRHCFERSTILPENFFEGLTALTTLDLSMNSLSHLPEGIFDDLTALTTLELNQNQFFELPEGIFDQLTALTTLRLGSQIGASLTFRDVSIFNELTALTTLELYDNRLTSLNAALFNQTTALTSLNLHSNQLSTLPENIFSSLSALTTLDLTDNEFETLPDGFFIGLESLETILLSHNPGDPFTITITFEEDPVDSGDNIFFKAKTATGAPFDIRVTLNVSGDGEIQGSENLTIPKGATTSTDSAEVIPIGSGTTPITISVGQLTYIPGSTDLSVSRDDQQLIIDRWSPTATVSVPEKPQKGDFQATITFSEPVENFAQEDVTLTDNTATASITNWEVSTDNTTYTATITPTTNGNVTISVPEDVAADAAENLNTASNTQTVSVDVEPPTVTLSQTALWYREAFDVTITFSEPVNDFVQTDVTLDRIVSATENPATVTITNWVASADRTTYTATITPTETGKAAISVPASVATDDAGNPNTASVPRGVRFDTNQPTVSVTVPETIQAISFDVTITFNELVDDFVQTDISLIGSTATASITNWVALSQWNYTATVTPETSGDVSISIPADVATDTAGNANTASDTHTIAVDLSDPTATVSVPSGTQASTFDATINFSKPVTGFLADDISIAGTATASVTNLVGPDGAGITRPLPPYGMTYTATFTATTSGTVEFSIRANAVTDAGNRPNEDASAPTVVTVDLDGPTVTLSVPERTQAGAFDVTITFNEPVEDFLEEDVSLEESTATATITNWVDDGDDMTYTVTLTPTTSGEVIISVPENVATDGVGNPNTASTTYTVMVNLDALTVTISVPDGKQTQTFDATIAFKNAVSDFLPEDISLEGSTARVSITNLVSAKDDATYTVTFTAKSAGVMSISVPAGVATDAKSNTNLASSTLTFNVDFVVDISDADLDTAVKTALDIRTDGDLLASDVLRLTELKVESGTLESLSGVEPIINLTTLGIQGVSAGEPAPLTDLTPLVDLTNLTELTVRFTEVSDVSPLISLTELTSLTLTDNTISDITPLADLSTAMELITLALTGNKISNVAPLAALTSLETLSLAENSILDTSSLYPLLTANGGNLETVDIDVTEHPPWDVNKDGIVDAEDLAQVTAALGQVGGDILDPRTDVNSDGTVDNADLILVTDNSDTGNGAPGANISIANLIDPAILETLDRDVLEAQLRILRTESDGSAKYRDAIAMIEAFLAAARPHETVLLPNYPNPFNPETWIPYHLANPSNVVITIYDARGSVIRRLELGHQSEGYYTSQSRAVYWDGRNNVGEPVASGIYFYQLQADNTSLLRKMVILK